MIPIQTRLTLKPWFTEQALDKAAKLLKQGNVLIMHYRSAVAAVFPDQKGYCLVDFKKAPQISQGFRPINTECTICTHRQTLGDHCPHAAALISSILIEDEFNPTPAPMLFGSSKWQKLCSFMNEQGAGAKVTQDTDNSAIFSFQTKNFTAQINLPASLCSLLPVLFPHLHLTQENPAFAQDSIREAWTSLTYLCCTKGEMTLNEFGRTSKGQEKAKSLWTQICHHLFCNNPHPQWHLQRSSDHLFTLLSSPDDNAGLHLTPCRRQTIRLLQQSDNLHLVSIEGTAKAYSKIYFQEDDSLIIEPWLKLDDGHKQRRLDLQENIFGNHLSVENKIFMHIEEQKDDFSSKATSSNLPLLAFAGKKDPAAPIIIPALEIPAFLDKHLLNIIRGDHDTDPALEDFTINDLPDSIEVLDYNEDDEWCYLSARYACGDRQLHLHDILALRSAGKQHATGKGKWLQVNNTPLDWLYRRGKEQQQEGGDQPLRLSKLEMMALTSLVPELKLPQQKDLRQQIKNKLKNLKHKELAAADIPPHLRQYQQAGLNWLYNLYDNGIGGILADDMGLGKTHQALALLQIILRAHKGPALMICPASVLPHWQDKIDTFYPEIDYVVHYGQQRELTSLPPATLLLTTYGVMRRDIELLQKFAFGPIIFDEIHYLKNRQTGTSKAAPLLRSKACFGLSGTPLENSLTDLKSIYDLCLPGLLGSHGSFYKTYTEPIEEKHDQQRLAALQRLTSPFMLRRKKTTVLKELPEIIEDIRHCYLSRDQQSLYQQAIDHEGQELLAAVNNKQKPFPHMNFLALMQRLKQICNHPAMLSKSCDYQKYRSGKWELFKEILDECLDAGMKVVVFSQYTTMLDIIEKYLQDEDICYAGLRGDSTMKKRQQQVELFNNDPAVKVFSASLLAGGTGIDLTGAQGVIHYDRWWNSAKEEQATARVHRFGQKQAVQVFKFITTGTMEEKIHRLIVKKQDLADDAIICDDTSIIKKLSSTEIASILQWAPDTTN